MEEIKAGDRVSMDWDGPSHGIVKLVDTHSRVHHAAVEDEGGRGILTFPLADLTKVSNGIMEAEVEGMALVRKAEELGRATQLAARLVRYSFADIIGESDEPFHSLTPTEKEILGTSENFNLVRWWVQEVLGEPEQA